MKKLLQLYRAGGKLGMKIFFIYLQKMIRQAPDEKAFALLSYYNLLIDCNLTHEGTFDEGFIFRTDDNVLLHARVPPSSDFTVFRQIWKDEEYKGAVEAIRHRINTTHVNIIDAGANAGYATVYLVKRLQPKFGTKVVCIEPGEANVRILKKNLHINHYDHIVVEQAGLFNKPCHLKVSSDFRDGKEWSLQVEESATVTGLEAVEVSQIRIKNGWKQIDFLKIDIEGAERYLFADESYARGFLEKVRMISIEIHHEYGIEKRILQILKDNHFSYEQTGEITLGVNNSFN
ncbi:MAG TPA: FkbM family methyltransferase [Flavitalea sp.]|nr:FkbM family methyltransferase [Flavitalea sp.]